MTSIDALAGIAAIDAANEAEGGGADSGGWDFNQVSALTGSPTGSSNNISVLNVSPTNQSTTQSSITSKSAKSFLYDPTKPATAATSEELYPGRRAAIDKFGYGTPAYKEWDAATRALMGVKKGDKFSSGQWIETFGGMKPDQINEAAGNVEYYLDDETVAKKSGLGSSLSGWANKIMGRPEDISNQVIERLNRAGFTNEVAAALSVGGWPNIVMGGKMQKNAQASYHGPSDTIKLGEDWTVDDVVHELAHRAVMKAGGLENIQMPNVQALYEVGGNALSPGYGSQGEMVTSRAATAQNLVDAMQYNKTSFSGSGTAGLGGFAEAYGLFNPEEGFVNKDYWDVVTKSPSKNLVANSLSGPAAKGGWTANTPQAIGWYGANPVPMKVGSLSGAAVANPNYSVPGTGDWKGGYENFLALQNEMPSDYWGAATTPIDTVGFYAGTPVTDEMTEEQAQKAFDAYDTAWRSFKSDFKDGTFGPASATGNWGGGLWNSPMQGAHALVQEFMIRNKSMLEDAEKNDTVKEAMYNKFVAENVASPASKISIMERLGLAQEFWDKLGYMTQ